MIDLREQRLPKWAQAELTRLRANVKSAERAAYEALNSDETDTYIETDWPRVKRGLPAGMTVHFRVGGTVVGVRVEGGCLRVLSCTSGISIRPEASNYVTIHEVIR